MGAVEELLEYLRVHVCLSSAAVALLGFLSFHPFSAAALLVFFSIFFVVGSVYSCNFLTDRPEDEKNSPLASNRFIRSGKLGALVSASSALAGLLLSAMLSPLHLILSCLLLLVGHGYSSLRLKRLFLFKNAVIGAAFGMAYLYGAGFLYLPGLLLILLVIIAMSIIADLRDYCGDKSAGIMTIPVVLGMANSKQAVQILLLAAFAVVAIFRPSGFLPLLLFIPAALLILHFHKNPYISHLYMRSGLVTLVVVELLLSLPV